MSFTDIGHSQFGEEAIPRREKAHLLTEPLFFRPVMCHKVHSDGKVSALWWCMHALNFPREVWGIEKCGFICACICTHVNIRVTPQLLCCVWELWLSLGHFPGAKKAAKAQDCDLLLSNQNECPKSCICCIHRNHSPFCLTLSKTIVIWRKETGKAQSKSEKWLKLSLSSSHSLLSVQ